LSGAPVDPQAQSGIRRGQGLRLSTHTAADDRADMPAEAAATLLRRGQGLRLSTQASDDALDTAIPPAQRLRLRHGEIVYRQAGSGPPLLLLHGWGASSRYWFSTQAQLSDIRTCYALDLPGFGESAPLRASGSVERLAEVVLEAADALGLGQLDLNGHSFGAWVAVYLAARWPARIRSLVVTALGVRRSLVERAMLGLAHGPADLTVRLAQPWINAWRPWLGSCKPLTELVLGAPPVARLLAGWYLDRIPADRRLLREGIADLVRMDLGAHLACVASVGAPALVDALQSIRVPALFIGGDHDRVAPPDDLGMAAELAPGSQTVLLEHCGHVPMIEQPVAYQTALRTFLLGA
jgi:pimeloyl-ACP methyl ester carboxylesterase